MINLCKIYIFIGFHCWRSAGVFDIANYRWFLFKVLERFHRNFNFLKIWTFSINSIFPVKAKLTPGRQACCKLATWLIVTSLSGRNRGFVLNMINLCKIYIFIEFQCLRSAGYRHLSYILMEFQSDLRTLKFPLK